MESIEFKKYLTKYFAPEIRTLGFKGSGLKFSKISGNHLIYFIQIWPNKWGGDCYIDYAVHVDFLPEFTNLEIMDPKKMAAIDAVFRNSLGQEKFHYGANETEAKEQINLMVEAVKNKGLNYFDRFNKFPEVLTDITLEDLKNGTWKWISHITSPIGMALQLSRINLFFENPTTAAEFAKYGLSLIEGKRGSGLITMFDRLIAGDKNFIKPKYEIEKEKEEMENLFKQIGLKK